MKILKIDIGDVPWQEQIGFVKGVEATIKALENAKEDTCPKCGGTVQSTFLGPPDDGVAIGCNRCSWPEHPFQVKGNNDMVVELTPAEKNNE